jgi:hypothetical protein
MRRRSKLLLGDVKETICYWILKEEALDRPQWRTCFEKSMDLSGDRQGNEGISMR